MEIIWRLRFRRVGRKINMAPELDDPRHAALVQELADKVKEAYKAIEAANMVGYH